jgi:hypothetical protein
MKTTNLTKDEMEAVEETQKFLDNIDPVDLFTLQKAKNDMMRPASKKDLAWIAFTIAEKMDDIDEYLIHPNYLYNHILLNS